MRLIILFTILSLSCFSQTKGDTIKVLLPSEKVAQKEIERLLKQYDSIETLIYYYRNLEYYRKVINELKIK